jgi:hypothetical protein
MTLSLRPAGSTRGEAISMSALQYQMCWFRTVSGANHTDDCHFLSLVAPAKKRVRKYRNAIIPGDGTAGEPGTYERGPRNMAQTLVFTVSGPRPGMTVLAE